MALAFENGGAPTPQAGFPGSSTFTFAFTADADCDILVSQPAWSHTAALSVNGVTYAAAALNEVPSSEVTLDTGANGYGIKGCGQWYRVAPATGANNVVITMSGNCREYTPGTQTYSGADQTNPVGDGGAVTGSAVDTGSTSAAIAVTVAAGEIAVGVCCTAADNATSVSSGDTQAWEVFTGSQFGTTANGSYQTADGNLNWTVPNTNVYGYCASGFPLRVAGAGGATDYEATGDLGAQSSAVAGSATVGRTSTGALAAQAASIAGAATLSRAASGTLNAQAAAVAGAATVGRATSGALSAQAAAIAGTATVSRVATGDLESASATVDGSATIAAASFLATGSLQAQAAAVAGAVTISRAAAGALAAQAAVISGSAETTAEPAPAPSSGPPEIQSGGFGYMVEMRAVAERLHKRRKRLKRFLLLLG